MAFPVIAAAVMAAAQIAKGFADSGRASGERREAMDMHRRIPREDPGVARRVRELEDRARYAERGQSSMLDVKRRLADETGMETQRGIVRGAGSSPGTTIQGLLRSQNVTQRNKMIAGAESEQLGLQYMGMSTPLIADMADRKLSLDTYMRDFTAFQAAQRQQNANNMIAQGIGLGASVAMGVEAGGGKEIDPNAAEKKSLADQPETGMDPIAPSTMLPTSDSLLGRDLRPIQYNAMNDVTRANRFPAGPYEPILPR